MQIKAGQYYRTRSGNKAFVGAANPFQQEYCSHPLAGYIQGHTCHAKWTREGRICHCYTTHPDDLIAEWKEPVTATIWCCLWDDGGMSMHSFRPTQQPSLKAIKQVTITEGEGM